MDLGVCECLGEGDGGGDGGGSVGAALPLLKNGQFHADPTEFSNNIITAKTVIKLVERVNRTIHSIRPAVILLFPISKENEIFDYF